VSFTISLAADTGVGWSRFTAWSRGFNSLPKNVTVVQSRLCT